MSIYLCIYLLLKHSFECVITLAIEYGRKLHGKSQRDNIWLFHQHFFKPFACIIFEVFKTTHEMTALVCVVLAFVGMFVALASSVIISSSSESTLTSFSPMSNALAAAELSLEPD